MADPPMTIPQLLPRRSLTFPVIVLMQCALSLLPGRVGAFIVTNKTLLRLMFRPRLAENRKRFVVTEDPTSLDRLGLKTGDRFDRTSPIPLLPILTYTILRLTRVR